MNNSDQHNIVVVSKIQNHTKIIAKNYFTFYAFATNYGVNFGFVQLYIKHHQLHQHQLALVDNSRNGSLPGSHHCCSY